MNNSSKFYIDGEWTEPKKSDPLDVINPATEQPIASINLGSVDDVNIAVVAARRALKSFSSTTVQERIKLITRIQEIYQKRMPDIAESLVAEIGAPATFAQSAQVFMGWAHFPETLRLLKEFQFEKQINDRTTILSKPVGVCGLITPWNWPLNQILCKVLPALAAGCTMILKPSEVAPLNAIILAEILDEAGVPPGVFNLINGTGTGVGEAISSHPGIDMVSFTGSTRAGIAVAKSAASTVKRVTQELGGKSANIILDDAALKQVVRDGVNAVMMNSGQSCMAPTRMLVPAAMHAQACSIAKQVAESTIIVRPDAKAGESMDFQSQMHGQMEIGPVVSAAQFAKVQELIDEGIAEGADLVAGGLGRPAGINSGYYVKPTIFGNVKSHMRIAQEEIFGPVLCILPYQNEEQAIEIANDSVYGLSGYVSSESVERARNIAKQIETGAIHINGSGPDFMAPFGGVKQSGNGREWGEFGLEEFLESRAIIM